MQSSIFYLSYCEEKLLTDIQSTIPVVAGSFDADMQGISIFHPL